ncbi:MAG: hypothetical protein MUO78_03440 [candidate division Zixibacteria bacterium]|nr:hypothetical protein [candidate division Zixibacteria bacterium]
MVQKLSKYEKLSIFMSVLAIILSLLIAIIGYYFTHPIVEEIKFGGRIVYWGDYLYANNKITGLHLKIKNVGYKHTQYLDITFATIENKVKLNTMKEQITFVPVCDFEFKKDANHVYIKLQRPLSKGEEIQMFINGIVLEDNRFTYDLRCDIFSDFGGAAQLEPFKTL